MPGGRQGRAFRVEETVCEKGCRGKVLDQASITWGMEVRSGMGSLKRLRDLPQGPNSAIAPGPTQPGFFYSPSSTLFTRN